MVEITTLGMFAKQKPSSIKAFYTGLDVEVEPEVKEINIITETDEICVIVEKSLICAEGEK